MKDGGQAFPPATSSLKGMSLRDWFAGQALAGLLSTQNNMLVEELTESAYAHADAMLAEREKRGSP